jgi:hypothetical protein
MLNYGPQTCRAGSPSAFLLQRADRAGASTVGSGGALKAKRQPQRDRWRHELRVSSEGELGGFIHHLVQEDWGSIVRSFQSSPSGSLMGAGSCSSSSTCPLPLQSEQVSSGSSTQPRPLQCGQTFIASIFPC